MWAQIYDIVMFLLFFIMLSYRLVEHKEKIKNMSWLQLVGAALLYAAAIAIAVFIIYGTGKLIKPFELPGFIYWTIYIFVILFALVLSNLLIQKVPPRLMKDHRAN